MEGNARHRRARRALASVAVIALAAATVAVAGDRGLRIEIEAWSAASAGSSLEYAFVVPEDAVGSSISGGGEVRTIRTDREAAYGFRVGKRFDRPGDPTLEFGFREHDASGAGTTGDLPGRVGAILATADFALGRSLVDVASGNRRHRSTIGEAMFRFRWTDRPRAVVEVGGGVRWFRVEHETTVTYAVGADEEVLVRRGEADGIGPAASISFQYRLTERLRLGAVAGVAVPIGERRGASTDIRLGDRFTVVDREGERTAFFQPEIELRFTVELPSRVELYAAWRWQDLGATGRELRFVDDVAQNVAVGESSNYALEGVALGLRWSF